VALVVRARPSHFVLRCRQRVCCARSGTLLVSRRRKVPPLASRPRTSVRPSPHSASHQATVSDQLHSASVQRGPGLFLGLPFVEKSKPERSLEAQSGP